MSNRRSRGHLVTAVLLVILGSAVSARKRLGFVRLGAFGWWRALHTSAGVLGLATLVAHSVF